MKVQDIIAANPNACYRTLEAEVWKTLGKLDASDLLALAEARPECGYDCDDGCPVSGRREE